MGRRRPKDNKRRGMNRRKMGSKKPMSPEQKKVQKKLKEIQVERQRKFNEENNIGKKI